MKPKSDNSIFECRVLSRHHAHIWYEDEQIWVKDKGSSNGTFVNGMKVTGEQVSSKYFRFWHLSVEFRAQRDLETIKYCTKYYIF